jgi:hypothetical protein
MVVESTIDSKSEHRKDAPIVRTMTRGRTDRIMSPEG